MIQQTVNHVPLSIIFTEHQEPQFLCPLDKIENEKALSTRTNIQMIDTKISVELRMNKVSD